MSDFRFGHPREFNFLDEAIDAHVAGPGGAPIGGNHDPVPGAPPAKPVPVEKKRDPLWDMVQATNRLANMFEATCKELSDVADAIKALQKERGR